MNQEPWTDERLDRLASLIESNARVIQNLSQSIENHSQSIEENHKLIESNARVIQALAQASAEAREEREQLFRRMDQRDEEIRGMQLENRRILDILLNQRRENDPE